MPQTIAAQSNRSHSQASCDGSGTRSGKTVRLPIVEAGGIRPSRAGKRRAVVLLLVHVMILGHVLHWLSTGRTVSPIEPSEAKDLAMKGIVNAGFIFFATAIASTLVLGRFFCGWGCHLIAYQDLTLWILKKLHLRPRQFRSRLLVFVPLVAAIYMFAWPWIYRVWFGYQQPHLAVHLSTTGFWATFPSYGVAILTVLVCGVAIIYFLGPKGFCTYACPYGGIFGAVDQAAIGRIRVTEDCHQCGHCTAVCTSNVDVAREVNQFGMVVDPGCMKCLDCVSVCPNDALYVGFGMPALLAKTRADAVIKPPRKYDFTWPEELLGALIFVAAFLSFRGLYGKIPFLMSLGMAGIVTFVVIKALSMVYRHEAMLQKIRLKVERRIRPAGYAFLLAAIVAVGLTAHSGFWQYHDWLGRTAFLQLPGEELGWQHDPDFASHVSKANMESAMRHLQSARKWGLYPVDDLTLDISWLYVLEQKIPDATKELQSVLARHPDDVSLLVKKATYDVYGGQIASAEAEYRRALSLEAVERERIRRKLPDEPVPMSGLVWAEWGLFLASQNKVEDARTALTNATQFDATSVAIWTMLGKFEASTGRIDAARAALVRAVSMAPEYLVAQQALEGIARADQDFAAAVKDYDAALAEHPRTIVFVFNRAFALSALQRFEEAIAGYREVLRLRPQVTIARADLGALLMMRKDLTGAIQEYEEVVRQAPNEPEMAMRLAFLYVQTNRPADAEPLLRKAAQYGTPEQRAAALQALHDMGK